MRQDLQSAWNEPQLDLAAVASDVEVVLGNVDVEVVLTDGSTYLSTLQSEGVGLMANFNAIVREMKDRSDDAALQLALTAASNRVSRFSILSRWASNPCSKSPISLVYSHLLSIRNWMFTKDTSRFSTSRV